MLKRAQSVEKPALDNRHLDAVCVEETSWCEMNWYKSNHFLDGNILMDMRSTKHNHFLKGSYLTSLAEPTASLSNKYLNCCGGPPS